MIPYSRPKCSHLYTLSQCKLLENHTLHSGTNLYSPYIAVPPAPPRGGDHFTWSYWGSFAVLNIRIFCFRVFTTIWEPRNRLAVDWQIRHLAWAIKIKTTFWLLILLLQLMLSNSIICSLCWRSYFYFSYSASNDTPAAWTESLCLVAPKFYSFYFFAFFSSSVKKKSFKIRKYSLHSRYWFSVHKIRYTRLTKMANVTFISKWNSTARY